MFFNFLNVHQGSVPPNANIACIRNVTFRNINFEKALKAIYIKPNPGNYFYECFFKKKIFNFILGNSGTGLIKNITYENINIKNTLWWSIFIGR
jgi:hypothetical protein